MLESEGGGQDVGVLLTFVSQHLHGDNRKSQLPPTGMQKTGQVFIAPDFRIVVAGNGGKEISAQGIVAQGKGIDAFSTIRGKS